MRYWFSPLRRDSMLSIDLVLEKKYLYSSESIDLNNNQRDDNLWSVRNGKLILWVKSDKSKHTL